MSAQRAVCEFCWGMALAIGRPYDRDARSGVRTLGAATFLGTRRRKRSLFLSGAQWLVCYWRALLSPGESFADLGGRGAGGV